MTYSLGVTGYVVGGFNTPTTKIYDIPDLSNSGIQMTGDGRKQAMRKGDLMLVQRPDGSQGYYRFDAERSTEANPILVAV